MAKKFYIIGPRCTRVFQRQIPIHHFRRRLRLRFVETGRDPRHRDWRLQMQPEEECRQLARQILKRSILFKVSRLR